MGIPQKAFKNWIKACIPNIKGEAVMKPLVAKSEPLLQNGKTENELSNHG